jgi:hypothetical protein
VILVLVLLPGPNVALIVANSLSFGRRLGLVTAQYLKWRLKAHRMQLFAGARHLYRVLPWSVGQAVAAMNINQHDRGL